MDEELFYEVPGEEVDSTDLQLENSEQVVNLLNNDRFPYFEFIACKKDESENEYVVLEVEPSIPQKPKTEIKRRERLFIKFVHEEDGKPETYALRKGFPHAPHINFTPEGTPKHLCLSVIPYDEEQIHWTAARYLKLIHRWLSKTSKNNLHLQDQPLERIFYGTVNRIILPSYYFDIEKDIENDVIDFAPLPEIDGQFVVVGLDKERAEKYYGQVNLPFKCFTFDISQEVVHGIIEYQPTNLLELHDYLKDLNFNLLLNLRSRLFQSEPEELRNNNLLLILRIPKKRSEEGSVEDIEVLSFLAFVDLLELSTGLGILYRGHRRYQGEMNRIVKKNAKNLDLSILNPTSILTPEKAAGYNNLKQASHKSITAIGVGALGSQVILNTARAGQGKWHLIDKDHFLPHNAARHALPTAYMGMPKTTAMKTLLDRMYLEESISTKQEINVLEAEEDNVFDQLENSDIICDFSASVAVARKLSLDFEIPTPRISLFLNPDGEDLIMLAESKDRSYRLDTLEMEYYKSLYKNEELFKHLESDGSPIRYAQNCRDLSSKIPQYLIGIHSGIGSKQIIKRFDKHALPKISIWSTNDMSEVKRHDIQPAKYLEKSNDNWDIATSEKVLSEIDEERTQKLPSETGGVLIGSIDHLRNIIYIVDYIKSPSDSDEWPRAYIRGTEGLEEKIQEINKKTAGNLGYIGEWHSHPKDADLNASDDDEVLFGWLQNYRELDSSPAVMAIVGDKKSSWYVAQTEESIDLSIN